MGTCGCSLGKTDTTIYVNGVKKKLPQRAVMHCRNCLEIPAFFRLEKANWGNGEYAQASIDNLKIYNKALTQTEVQNEVPDTFIEEAIASVKNKIKDVVLADSQEVLRTTMEL